MKPEFEAFYPAATEPYRSQLYQFRESHNPQVIHCQGIEWTYLKGGEGDAVVLVLHGGGGPAESLFRYIQALEESYRVIAPTVPAGVSTVAAALDAILAILDQEAVPAVHIFGVSNGGMVGQCLVRQRPQRALSLVLFLSMLPSADYARVFRRRARLFALLPGWLSANLAQRWVDHQIDAEAPNARPGEKQFWLAYFREFYGSGLVTKAHFKSRASLLADYFGNYRFDPQDLDDWPGRIFIIESENDQVVNRHERERLKRFYEHAQVHTFLGADHLGGGLFNVEETVDLLEGFFSRT